MHHFVRFWLIPGMALVLVSFAGIVSANSPVSWPDLDLKLNGIGVGVETPNKVLLVSLGEGFKSPTSFDALFNYQHDGEYTLVVNGSPIKNTSNFRFTGIQYGTTLPIQRYFNGELVDTYTLLFTNLPVVALKTYPLKSTFKRPAMVRVMSAKFNQDTGWLKQSAIQNIRGTSYLDIYPKCSYALTIGNKSAHYWLGKSMPLLDMRSASEWNLLAMYFDKSYARNLIVNNTYSVLRDKADIGVKGAPSPRGHLVEVLQNDVYQGVYTLSEAVTASLADLKQIDVPTDGGKALWEQADFKKPENGSVLYRATLGDTVFYDTASLSTNFDQMYPQREAVTRWEPLIELTHFIKDSSDKDFASGIAGRVNIDSVVDWWLLIELSSSADNLKKNFYLAKNGAGKFFIVPWMHDASFGLFWTGIPVLPSQGTRTWMDTDENNLLHRLLTLPASGFNTKLKARWKQISPLAEQYLIGQFQSYDEQVMIGGAKSRDILTWPESNAYGAQTGSLVQTADFIKVRLQDVDRIIQQLPES